VVELIYKLDVVTCTVSKVPLQPAGASVIPVRSLSVPIVGCAVSVSVVSK
jgi:hypothetical protein